MRIFVCFCTHLEYKSLNIHWSRTFLNTGLAANVVQTTCCDSCIYTLCSVDSFLCAFYPLNSNFQTVIQRLCSLT